MNPVTPTLHRKTKPANTPSKSAIPLGMQVKNTGSNGVHHIIDTHTHLNFRAFESDWRAVADQAVQGGVRRMVMPGSLLQNSQKAVEMAAQHPALWAAVGLHPTHVTDGEFEKKQFRDLAQKPKVVAIGEVGLDRFRHTERATYEQQRDVLQQALALAHELALPVIIHARPQEDRMAVYEDILTLLRPHVPKIHFVVHCFMGNQAVAEAVLKAGGLLSFTGIVTLPSAPAYLRAVTQTVPLQRMMVETDSPYLRPAGWKEQRNTPLGAWHVVRFLASVRSEGQGKIAAVSTANAEGFFRFDERCERSG